MAILDILNYPDPRLHKVAKPVMEVNDAIRQLIENMAETMYAAPGIGLAATQVNQHIQLIIVDISETKDQLQVFINPKIIEKHGEQEYEEGCLSVPGIYDVVTRAERVKIEALDQHGNKFTLLAENLLSVCVQHEMDHLLGKVFVEYLSPLKRTRIKNKLLKQHRGKDGSKSRHNNI